jgi:hypothetical protein
MFKAKRAQEMKEACEVPLRFPKNRHACILLLIWHACRMRRRIHACEVPLRFLNHSLLTWRFEIFSCVIFKVHIQSNLRLCGKVTTETLHSLQLFTTHFTTHPIQLFTAHFTTHIQVLYTETLHSQWNSLLHTLLHTQYKSATRRLYIVN